MCFGHASVPCRNGGTDQDGIWGEDWSPPPKKKRRSQYALYVLTFNLYKILLILLAHNTMWHLFDVLCYALFISPCIFM